MRLPYSPLALLYPSLLAVLVAGVGTMPAHAAEAPYPWRDLYTKATIATFYSASVLNGYYDLRLAETYLDSVEASIKRTPPPAKEYAEALGKVVALRRELSVSRGIAEDNMNHRYPAFSLMGGHRPELNDVDDTQELLVETVIDRAISSPDPLVKGNLKDNTHFVLLSVVPHDQTLVTVGLDHLAATTGFYGIRPHELANILDAKGLARYRAAMLDSADHWAIMQAYGIDRMVCLTVRDNGSAIPGLFYKGITLQTVTLPDPRPRFVSYFEAFKVDKKASWSAAVTLFAANAAICIALLLLMALVRFELVPLRVGLFFSKELGVSLLLLVGGALASIFLSYYLSTFFPTEINQYAGDLSAILWVLHQVMAPTVITFGVCYLLQYKFGREVVNSATGFTRLLYVSFTFPALLVGYFEYHAELLPAGFWKYLMPVQAALFLPVAVQGGRVINALVKKESIGPARPVMLGVCFALWWLAIWSDLRDLNDLSLGAMGASAALAVVGMVQGRLAARPSGALPAGFSGSGHGLLNPVSYLEAGTNIPVLREEVRAFIGGADRLVLVLTGERGVGKTRFIRELRELLRTTEPGVVVYSGDCDEFLEGNNQLYEPFYNAFCQHEGAGGSLPKGFFADRGGIGRGLSKVVKMVGAAAPVDIGAMLSVEEGSGRSVKEIAAELVDLLVARLDELQVQRHVLIIDDCQWMDQGTLELLGAFVELIKVRTRHTRYFKLILVAESRGSKEEANAKTSDPPFVRWLLTVRNFNVSACELVMQDELAFVRSLVAMDDLRIGQDPDVRVGFASVLKAHLLQLCEEEAGKGERSRGSADGTIRSGFTPGDVFGYLAALERKGFLKIDGQMLRLTVEPPGPEEVSLKSGRGEVMSAAFNGLEAPDQLLLESAAHIGFKFDADILASIWKHDVLDVLRQLERLQEAGFVNDLREEDNIYAFQDKELHRIIRTRRNRTEDNDEGVRQLVVEYQKRIIETMVNRGDAYISDLDLEILQSAVQRCFKYEKVDLIRRHTPLIGLYAALKYVLAGKISKCADTLLRIHPLTDAYTPQQIALLARILSAAVDQGTLQDFDRPVPGPDGAPSATNLLDDLLRRARNGQQADFETLNHVLLRDIQKRSSNRRPEEISALFTSRRARIQQYQQGFVDAGNRMRVDFYMTLIDRRDAGMLRTMLQAALDQDLFDLAGEIARHLSLVSSGRPDEQLRYAGVSLALLIGQVDAVKDLDAFQPPTAEEIKRTLYELLGRENLRSRKASDLNYTISRFRDHYYATAGTANPERYEHCLYFCELAFDLSVRLNDERGQEMAMSYKGAALHQLGRHTESLAAYRAYFEWLITRTKDKGRFSYVIEGIGLNCQALNDHAPYEWLKRELYEHLLYVSQGMQEQELRFSLFDKTRKLRDVLPAAAQQAVDPEAGADLHEQRVQAVERIMEVLVCLAKADGRVDDHERHDLTESAIALAYSMDLPHRVVRARMDDVFARFGPLDAEQRLGGFRDACQWLARNESAHFARAVFQLCLDMVHADGVVTPEEERYVEAANAILGATPRN